MNLFETRSGRVEFVVLEEEMARVANLIAVTEDAVRSELRHAREELCRLERGEQRVIDPEWGDMTGEAIDGMHDGVIPDLEWIATTLSNGAHHLLVFALLERCLRFLCHGLSANGAGGSGRSPRNRSLSAIDHYLAQLRDPLGFSFELPGDFAVVQQDARRMRNAFAHGDWDGEIVRADAVPPSRLLEIIAELFVNLERAVYPDG